MTKGEKVAQKAQASERYNYGLVEQRFSEWEKEGWRCVRADLTLREF